MSRAALSLVLGLGAVNAACGGYRPVPTVDVRNPAVPRPVEGTPLSEVWQVRAGRGIGEGVASSDTVVYVGGADRNVYALDLRNGARRWTMRINGPVVEGVTWDGTRIYAATEVPDGKVYALDAVRGTRTWTASTGPAGAPLVVAGGLVLVSTRRGQLLGLEPGNGHQVWERQTGVALASPIEAAPGTVLLATVDSLFRLETATGRVLERTRAPGAVTAPWIRSGRHLLAGTADSLVVAVPLDTLAGGWTVRLDAPILGSPAASGDTVFAVSRVGTVYRISTGGSPAPATLIRLRRPITASPVILGEWILVGTADGELVAVTRAGAIAWETRVTGPVDLTPVTLADGFIAIGGRGEMRRFRL